MINGLVCHQPFPEVLIYYHLIKIHSKIHLHHSFFLSCHCNHRSPHRKGLTHPAHINSGGLLVLRNLSSLLTKSTRSRFMSVNTENYVKILGKKTQIIFYLNTYLIFLIANFFLMLLGSLFLFKAI